MNDATEITVGGSGVVSVAPVGTTQPADILASLDAAFIELGFLGEEGVTFVDSKTMEEIPAWQSFYAVRRIVTGREASATFELLQWNDDNVVFAFGGGAVIEDQVGAYTYTPPATGTFDERIMSVAWVDGSKNYRLIIPVGMPTDAVETQLFKGDAGKLPIVFGVNGSDVVAPWYIQTDDPAMNPA